MLQFNRTGTLTKNKLSLGDPYTVKGVESNELMLTACLAASRKIRGLDAIDKAFLKALKDYGKVKQALSKFKILQLTPFDPVSKKVTAVVEGPSGEKITCVKGAPMAVLQTVLAETAKDPLVEEEYNQVVEEFASRGFRSLGVARKREGKPWKLLGIMPLLDPPRHDTKETIHEAKKLGLKIKMLTGDAVGIAKETSRQLGLGTKIRDSEGLEIDGDDVAGFKYDFIEDADGFAEVRLYTELLETHVNSKIGLSPAQIQRG